MISKEQLQLLLATYHRTKKPLGWLKCDPQAIGLTENYCRKHSPLPDNAPHHLVNFFVIDAPVKKNSPAYATWLSILHILCPQDFLSDMPYYAEALAIVHKHGQLNDENCLTILHKGLEFSEAIVMFNAKFPQLNVMQGHWQTLLNHSQPLKYVQNLSVIEKLKDLLALNGAASPANCSLLENYLNISLKAQFIIPLIERMKTEGLLSADNFSTVMQCENPYEEIEKLRQLKQPPANAHIPIHALTVPDHNHSNNASYNSLEKSSLTQQLLSTRN